MAQDFLNTYKYGWKTSYYQNTYDNKTDEVKEEPENSKLDDILNELTNSEEEAVKAVQFKVSPEMMNKNMTEVKRLTVFNTEQVDSKKQPMFFGKPLGVQRYDSYKYPVFEKLTTQQLGYFWRPEEISLQKDRGDYLTLRPEQKHIYISNLKYQIMLDSVQGRALGWLLLLTVLSLNLSLMKVWEFMEMVHSRSYTHIIKNIYSDPSEVFDTILKDDRILERAKTVTESYDDFVNSFHVYDQNNFWELANEGHDLGKIERKELKRKLYRVKSCKCQHPGRNMVLCFF